MFCHLVYSARPGTKTEPTALGSRFAKHPAQRGSAAAVLPARSGPYGAQSRNTDTAWGSVFPALMFAVCIRGYISLDELQTGFDCSMDRCCCIQGAAVAQEVERVVGWSPQKGW